MTASRGKLSAQQTKHTLKSQALCFTASHLEPRGDVTCTLLGSHWSHSSSKTINELSAQRGGYGSQPPFWGFPEKRKRLDPHTHKNFSMGWVATKGPPILGDRIYTGIANAADVWTAVKYRSCIGFGSSRTSFRPPCLGPKRPPRAGKEVSRPSRTTSGSTVYRRTTNQNSKMIDMSGT